MIITSKKIFETNQCILDLFSTFKSNTENIDILCIQ